MFYIVISSRLLDTSVLFLVEMRHARVFWGRKPVTFLSLHLRKAYRVAVLGFPVWFLWVSVNILGIFFIWKESFEWFLFSRLVNEPGKWVRENGFAQGSHRKSDGWDRKPNLCLWQGLPALHHTKVPLADTRGEMRPAQCQMLHTVRLTLQNHHDPGLSSPHFGNKQAGRGRRFRK